jgi:hypothetical protein
MSYNLTVCIEIPKDICGMDEGKMGTKKTVKEDRFEMIQSLKNPIVYANMFNSLYYQ